MITIDQLKELKITDIIMVIFLCLAGIETLAYFYGISNLLDAAVPRISLVSTIGMLFAHYFESVRNFV